MSQVIEIKVPDIGDYKDVPVIEVHINHLRRKLELPGCVPILQTIRGKGYRLGDAL